jgi:hypothetical protein
MYSQQQKDEIINQICIEIESGKSLRSVLKNEGMPNTQAFYDWIDSDVEKSKQYVRACEARADSIFEDILDIADDSSNDIQFIDNGDFEIEKTNQENIQRSRLRVDARKWMLGKMNPKKYGDKIQNEHSGEINIQPIFPDA